MVLVCHLRQDGVSHALSDRLERGLLRQGSGREVRRL